MSVTRRSGLLAPLFSLASTRSWGVGEFLDLPVFAKWAQTAHQSFVQILPITEIPESDTSPYSALTAMALDPIYISVPAMEDFHAAGGERRFTADDHAALQRIKATTRVDHGAVRSLKSRWLRRSYEHFMANEVPAGSIRAQAFVTFMRDEAWWLDDYALFLSIRARQSLRPWWDWPEPLARRHDEVMTQAREQLRGEIYLRKYIQWIAAQQWADARQLSRPLQVFGDVPFMISADSPDVWTRQSEFRFDATVGVPPDAFSDTGQDWGLPPWRWEVMAQSEFEWMKRRARRTAALFDGFRLDHLVGLYRTYMRPIDKSIPPFFAPDQEWQQQQLGEQLIGLYNQTGAEIIAEDLGTVPDFVRASLHRMGVPGFKVMRWEKHWHSHGQPFVDPADYPETSVATTGTHDTEPMVTWWEHLSADERRQVLQIPSLRRELHEGLLHQLEHSSTFERALNDALLRSLLEARSQWAIIPLQDLFGWRDRINTPAQVSDENWTWRLPWMVDELADNAEATSRADALARWTDKAGRRSPAETL